MGEKNAKLFGPEFHFVRLQPRNFISVPGDKSFEFGYKHLLSAVAIKMKAS